MSCCWLPQKVILTSSLVSEDQQIRFTTKHLPQKSMMQDIQMKWCQLSDLNQKCAACFHNFYIIKKKILAGFMATSIFSIRILPLHFLLFDNPFHLNVCQNMELIFNYLSNPFSRFFFRCSIHINVHQI